MATDTLDKQAAIPCQPATREELDEMLRAIYDGNNSNLSAFVRARDTWNIPWEKVCHLRIVGDSSHSLAVHFENCGIFRRFHLSVDSSWLLVRLPTTLDPQNYLIRCGEQLESLWIRNTLMDALTCSMFPALMELHLEGNDSLTQISGLRRLSRLERIIIDNCPRLKTISDLSQLTNLTSLNLSGCRILTALSGLENLTQLNQLNLSGCKSLPALPGLENLTQLTALNLSHSNSLTELPGLENLIQLTSLNLYGCSALTTLPGLENLTQLTTLNLYRCSALTALPGLENLTQLTSLNLSFCSKLNELPDGIRCMTSLLRLDLSFMKLQTLPDWLPEIAEGFSLGYGISSGKNKATVYLLDTTVEDIPDMSIFAQPYEMVVKFFEERRLGRTRLLNEIKVVFLGDGEAGKSHTIARLMNDGGAPVDYVDSSTPGIVIKDREYTAAESRTFRVHYWDFGGQEIMHSMHRIFLTGRTMYVVLLNARDDTQGDRAHYWLHNIQSFAPGAPVLLVLNKIDQNPKASVDERTLRTRYPGLTRIVRLSAKDFSQKDFNREFTDVLLDEIKNTGYLDAQWPGAWIRVKERLEKMESHYIWGDDYKDICRECQVDSNQENLLLWFNDLGVSFCCRDENDYALEDYVILRPDWITNALYIILFNRLEGAENGLIPHRSIYGILKNACNNPAIHCTLPTARYNSGDIQYVLGIMRKFSLSFPHGTDHEFIPMLCQQDSMVDIQKCHENSSILEFNMDFDYLPNNLLHRLMVERHSELDMDKVWRTGARFHLPELGLSAVVVIDGSTLRFFISHENDLHRPNTYLTMLKTNVDRIVAKMNLKPPTCQLIYKLDGKCEEFEFGLLKEMLDAGETTIFSRIQRKSIPIANVLNQSAPDGLENEMKLLDAIRRSCQNILGEPDYYLKGDGHGMEDKRNRRLRDDLYGWGYHIQDQTQRGRSGSEKGIGELDFLLHNDKRELWTAIEALRVSNGTMAEWKKHLNKLIGNYNFFGARFLYLLTYVDADDKSFARIWKDYQRKIPKYNPDPYMYSSEVLTDLSNADHQNIKTARCQYTCGGNPITVYHIFVRIPTQNG